MKFVDGHIHLWLEDYSNSSNKEKEKDYKLILNQVKEFKKIGGRILIDSNPPGTGRNGNILERLNRETGVEILTVSGFHKKIYYKNKNFKILEEEIEIEEIESFFSSEVSDCLIECIDTNIKKRADLIKVVFLGDDIKEYRKLTEAALRASKKTNTPIMVHTEEGFEIEHFVDFLKDRKVNPKDVMICHIDKRNDLRLHMELAKDGFYLEYDTFCRPKYNPENNLYPLIKNMVSNGYAGSIIAASDIYGKESWKNFANSGGFSGFFNEITHRLFDLGISEEDVKKIVCTNARNFLKVNEDRG